MNHKIPKDIELMLTKGNFVIAIKTLSQREGISLDEAKQKIDAFEAHLNADKPDFNHLVDAVDQKIASQGVPTWMTSKWFRIAQVVIFMVLLVVLLRLFNFW